MWLRHERDFRGVVYAAAILSVDVDDSRVSSMGSAPLYTSTLGQVRSEHHEIEDRSFTTSILHVTYGLPKPKNRLPRLRNTTGFIGKQQETLPNASRSSINVQMLQVMRLIE